VDLDKYPEKIDVVDVVTKKQLSRDYYMNKFVVNVEPYKAIIDINYFLNKIEECVNNRITELIKMQGKDIPLIPNDLKLNFQNEMSKLPGDVYLEMTVLPLLQNAINMCDMIRPPDPITFIANFMLINKDKAKSLEDIIRELPQMKEKKDKDINLMVSDEIEDEKFEEEKVEEKKEEEENAQEKTKEEEKNEEQIEINKENEIEEDKKEEEVPKTQYEIEKENEYKLLEKKSEILRRYLAENVLPLLSLGILQVANDRPDDPVEALADFLLAKTFENEQKEIERKNKQKEENNNENKNEDKKEENNGNISEKKNVENEDNKNKEEPKRQNTEEIDYNINEAKQF
jgi:hypothetical protein